MTPTDVDAWGKLGHDIPSGEAISAVLFDAERTRRLFAGVDSNDQRHLLIELEESDSDLTDRSSRGLDVTTRDLIVADAEPSRYIDVTCHETLGHPALNMIAGELAEQLMANAREPAEIMKRLMAKWRRFWGRQHQNILSHEEQIGLFGELWFLLKWVIPSIGSTGVEHWRGPWKEPHDFVFRDRSVEVKGSLRSGSTTIRISSLEQLQSISPVPLFLMSLLFRESDSSDLTLPSIVEKCYSVFEDDIEMLGIFESGLLEVGYSPLHEGEYANRHISVIAEFLYSVENDFPRLTSSILGLSIPSGVDNVRYTIDLQGFDHLIVAKSPSDWDLEVLRQ